MDNGNKNCTLKSLFAKKWLTIIYTSANKKTICVHTTEGKRNGKNGSNNKQRWSDVMMYQRTQFAISHFPDIFYILKHAQKMGTSKKCHCFLRFDSRFFYGRKSASDQPFFAGIYAVYWYHFISYASNSSGRESKNVLNFFPSRCCYTCSDFIACRIWNIHFTLNLSAMI